MGTCRNRLRRYCKTKKNLGVIFDENLCSKCINDAKIRKAYGVLNRIRHTQHAIPNYVKKGRC